ncbi:hypothetical protein OJF2_27400 [Aquisphaera giovannonii]|uniref:Uncharacterized protein n=1 Tax=Aquisphaera giovannonii TaxID=406548 RepID=A0A5B9W2F4_9BACT|nr:hypothetical protein [Aquisphaera giovannonii]QEH34205.1 hypothetical protein OJF2_27400 [Aquisphaera giovannonii]
MATHRKKRWPLLKRIGYVLAMLATGGAGAGGWAFKDRPILRAVYARLVGRDAQSESPVGDIKDRLKQAVVGAIAPDDPRKPGVFRVKIDEIQLDPKLFKPGRTVDMQARVVRIDASGKESIVWDSKEYGENLAVVGKDDLVASFTVRPFEIQWGADDEVVVQVWDRKGGLFDRRELKMALPEPGKFPLGSGTHALEVVGRKVEALESPRNRIVFRSERLRGLDDPSVVRARRNSDDARVSRAAGPRDASDRPIIIK